ncbi:MAG: DNA methyltransferase [Candidatus Micrarchaeaceae archaeon]
MAKQSLLDVNGAKPKVNEGDLHYKFYNDPEYSNLRARYNSLLALGYDYFTTVMPMKNDIVDEDIIGTSKAKGLYVVDNMFEKGSAYNISDTDKKVLVDNTNMRVSLFSKEITQAFVYFFTDKGDTVLDPFMGHDSRMTSVIETGRNYIGYDVAKKYVELTQERFNKMKDKHEATAILKWESSENISEPDNSVDLVFSSPPFWNAEYYDNDPRQIGNGTYQEFLDKLTVIISQCKRVLKPRHFIALHCEDIRRNGTLIPLHSDIIDIYKKLGIELTNIVVTPYTNFAKSFRINKIVQQYFGKAHGYIIVGKKS